MAKQELKKVLGTGFGIAMFVGGTIGAGILRTPGSVALWLQDYWLIALCWLFGGVYVLIGAGSFAEMATMIPKAGGPYNYVKRAFGDYLGFLAGWFDFLVNSLAPAYFCIVISEYIVILLPEGVPYQTLIAIGFLVVFTLFHLAGVKSGSIAQQVTSLVKVLFFLVLIVACFIVEPAKSVSAAPRAMEGGLFFLLVRSLQLVIGAYDGWWTVCFFAEEDKDPNKNIPRSLFIGGAAVTAIYVVLNLAIFYILPFDQISNPTLAAYDAAAIVFGSAGGRIVTFIAIASLVSILNAYMMIPARVLFGLSRDGFFIKAGARVNAGGTPSVGLLVSSAIAFLLILGGSSFEQLFSLGAFMSLIILGLSFAALPRLRVIEPNTPRPFKDRLYPYTTILLMAITLSLFAAFAYHDIRNFVIIIVIIVLSYPGFKLIQRREVTSSR